MIICPQAGWGISYAKRNGPLYLSLFSIGFEGICYTVKAALKLTKGHYALQPFPFLNGTTTP
jgi:hypothetical protein